MENNEKMVLSFAAIDPVIDRLVCAPTEKKQTSEDWVIWGDRNKYPHYIKDLCRTTPTLRSIILGLVDYVAGDDVQQTRGLRPDGTWNAKGETSRDIVRKTAKGISELGVICWKISRNIDLSVGEIEVIPAEYIRTNEENDVFYYCEDWDKQKYHEWVVYPKFSNNPDFIAAESILYVKLWGNRVYPEPIFAASVKAAQTERSIDDFHLGNIERGFMGSYVVNFNNGIIPTDQEKRQTEKEFTEKFAGAKNAGRIMFSWNRNKDAQTTLAKMEVSDYGEKYDTLSKHCRQQLFTAFRATPNLFSVAMSTGFSSEEYNEAFKLFNRTMVLPIQRSILDAFRSVLGEEVVTIIPFTLEGNTTQVR